MIHGVDHKDLFHHQDLVDQEDLVEAQVEVATMTVSTARFTSIQTTITVVEENIQTTTTVVEENIQTTTTVEEENIQTTTTVVEAPVEILMNQLTGSQEVRYLQSKTKDNAVAAGHSRPLEISLPEELSNTTLNQLITPSNNSLIAQDLTVTMDAKVELWTLLSNML